MTTVSVTVDVDVDLSDFDTDDLIAELESRGAEAPWASDPEALQKMFRALSLGDEKTALNLLRDYLCDALGRVM